MLPQNKPSALTLLLLIIFLTYNINAHFIQAYVLVYASCSLEKYQPNSPYETNLNSLISSIVTSSSQTLYNIFALGNDTAAQQDSASFGLYQCRGDLKTRDCATCIVNLINEIALLCPYTYGASLQLDGCFVTYERTDILGELDNSLKYKKCSSSGVINDAELLRRRDDVLADLQGAMAFRVSSTGPVEGYAQCLGDLRGPECSACLSDAVVKVKSLCGSAAAGDVFLGQCYVRYWEAGYYGSSPDSSNGDEVGKTVAIIVGVVAGVAVLIVLLSFCRKALG